MEYLHEEKRNGFDILIDYDQWAESPEEWGNFTVKHWRDYDDGTGELTINGSKFADGRAHWVDKYEHGGASYTLHGEGVNDRWDTSRKWGIIEFTNEYATNGDTLEARREMARGDLREYTRWANGEVLDVRIEEDGEWIDGNGGIYDDLDDAIEIARATVDRMSPKRESARAASASKLHI